MLKSSKKVFLPFILSALLILLLTGCGSQEPEQTADPAAPEKGKIIIQNFNFIPNQVTIKKGETITWVNNDANAHFIQGNGFISGDLYIKDTFSHTFKEAGTYEFSCTYHPEMKGVVIVE